MGARKLAVLAEDSPANRKEAVAHLERNGFEVFPFRDVKDVWSFLERRDEPVDLIAADDLMAGVDGFALLEKIRTSSVHAGTPFVIITADEEKTGPPTALRPGIAARLAKPIHSDSTAKIVQRIAGTKPLPVRILIVDDDPFFRKFASSLLAKEGYAVETSEGSTGAMAQILAQIPIFDLVVCDIHMPGGSGFELLKSVRTMGIKIPFLLISGTGFLSEQGVSLSRSSRLKFVQKDLLRVDLAASVNELLNQA